MHSLHKFRFTWALLFVSMVNVFIDSNGYRCFQNKIKSINCTVNTDKIQLLQENVLKGNGSHFFPSSSELISYLRLLWWPSMLPKQKKISNISKMTTFFINNMPAWFILHLLGILFCEWIVYLPSNALLMRDWRKLILMYSILNQLN